MTETSRPASVIIIAAPADSPPDIVARLDGAEILSLTGLDCPGEKWAAVLADVLADIGRTLRRARTVTGSTTFTEPA